MIAQQFAQLDNPVPDFVLLDPCPEGNEFKRFKAGNWAGWLGAEYGPVRAGGEYSIPDIARPERLSQGESEILLAHAYQSKTDHHLKHPQLWHPVAKRSATRLI